MSFLQWDLLSYTPQERTIPEAIPIMCPRALLEAASVILLGNHWIKLALNFPENPPKPKSATKHTVKNTLLQVQGLCDPFVDGARHWKKNIQMSGYVSILLCGHVQTENRHTCQERSPALRALVLVSIRLGNPVLQVEDTSDSEFNRKRCRCLGDVVMKTGTGLNSGTVFSLTFFLIKGIWDVLFYLSILSARKTCHRAGAVIHMCEHTPRKGEEKWGLFSKNTQEPWGELLPAVWCHWWCLKLQHTVYGHTKPVCCFLLCTSQASIYFQIYLASKN